LLLSIDRYLLPILLLVTALILMSAATAHGDERGDRQGVGISDVSDLASVPPPYSFDDGPIQPIEPIPPVGADPARCEMVQHCDGSGNCHWIQECR